MKIAVEGCCHGELEKIYETIEDIKKREGLEIDLLLCCGDFEAVRNKSDLESMAVPPKYRKMMSFHKYYSGEKVAPVLTIFIGGNHEAADYLWELPYGGWVAKNIYYLGYAGVINFGGIRIGGLSGIYKSHDYHKGHYEHPPFAENTKRSFYHIRSTDVFKLSLLTGNIDIMMSHDWPNGIHNYGNLEALLRWKKFLREDIESNTLGSPPAMELLKALKPSYWFSAHLHVKYAARIQHPSDSIEIAKETKFLALDKCLPNRDFLQIVDVNSCDSNKPYMLKYDAEWIGISQRVDSLYNTSPRHSWLPIDDKDQEKYTPSTFDLEEICKGSENNLTVPDNFVVTAPVYTAQNSLQKACYFEVNPQTELLCTTYNLTNPSFLRNKYPGKESGSDLKRKAFSSSGSSKPAKINHSSGSDSDDFRELVAVNENPDEIQINLSESDEDEITNEEAAEQF